MVVSKLTSKAQTTIPQPVRTSLSIGPGDEIAYEIADGRVLVTKAASREPRQGIPFEDLRETFQEWNRPDDAEAFSDLWAMDIGTQATPVFAVWDIVRVDFPFAKSAET